MVVAAVGSGTSAASLGCRSAGLDIAGPRCTPLLRWPLAKETPMPLQHVLSVLVVIKHLTPRREECLVIHGTHLCVCGGIIIQPLPCREVHVCLGMVSDACVYTHLLHGQCRIVALESCISCLAQQIRGHACQQDQSIPANTLAQKCKLHPPCLVGPSFGSVILQVCLARLQQELSTVD